MYSLSIKSLRIQVQIGGEACAKTTLGLFESVSRIHPMTTTELIFPARDRLEERSPSVCVGRIQHLPTLPCLVCLDLSRG